MATTGKHLLRIAALACFMGAPLSASAGNILFAHVDNYGSYVDDGNRIAGFLSNAGHSVTTRFLDANVYTDYDSFDQIFVYDLYSRTDKNNAQMSNYAGIASWYNGLTAQNLILDGRIISSDVTWTNANGMSSEAAWVQNYATQLALRGGGLVLGTDHNSFQSGINEINSLIGVGTFHGFFGNYPTSQAVVDTLSPLAIAGLDACRADANTRCINDNSTTGFVATGVQANGQTLTPLAYHGAALNAWDQAAISSTMGSITFGTCGGTNQPACTSVPVPGAIWLVALGLTAVTGSRRRCKSVQHLSPAQTSRRK